MERRIAQLKKEAINAERFFPHYVREGAEEVLFALSVFFISFSLLLAFLADTPFRILWPISEGIFLVCFSLLLATILFEVYIRSLYRRHTAAGVSLSAILSIYFHPKKKDPVHAFIDSHLGKEVMRRLGVSKESVYHFIERKEAQDFFSDDLISSPAFATLENLAHYLHESDASLRRFLESSHITVKDFKDASLWVEKKYIEKLDSRSYFNALLSKKKELPRSFEEAVRREVEEIEFLYDITFSEQALKQLAAFFSSDPYTYSSEESRNAFLVSIAEEVIHIHSKRHHGKHVILPSDARTFIINHKVKIQ